MDDVIVIGNRKIRLDIGTSLVFWLDLQSHPELEFYQIVPKTA